MNLPLIEEKKQKLRKLIDEISIEESHDWGDIYFAIVAIMEDRPHKRRISGELEEDYLYGAWHFGNGIYRGMVIDGKSHSVLHMSTTCETPQRATRMASNWIEENQLTGIIRLI